MTKVEQQKSLAKSGPGGSLNFNVFAIRITMILIRLLRQSFERKKTTFFFFFVFLNINVAPSNLTFIVQ